MVRDIPDGFIDDLRQGMTYEDIEDKYNMTPRSFRRRREQLPIKSRTINPQTGKKEFYLAPDDDFDPATEVNHSEPMRMEQDTKQVITQKANEFLTAYEKKIKNYRNNLEPEWPEMTHTDGREDIVIHRTDDHFGELVHDIEGNIIFDTDTAAERVKAVFNHAHDVIDAREAMGHDIQNAHLLLGGDHVTGEGIYQGQAHDLEHYLRDQIMAATAVYDEEIERLANRVEHLQIVCQAGNHGALKVDSASKQANADGIFFDQLEMMAYKGGLDNISFVKSDRSDHVNFMMRGHKGHLRHGQHVSDHIGTASPLSDWRSFLLEYDFDIAYRGHFHEHKIEHVNGTPVIMGGTLKPCGDYEGRLAIFGEPLAYIHGVNDGNPISWMEYTRFTQ